MQKMKAAVYTRYGPPEVLHMAEVEKPVAKAGELLIRNRAASVNSADWKLRKPEPFAVRFFFGLSKPRKPILGGIFAGEVEAVGDRVQGFKPGDRVFGTTGMAMGTYAQYICVPETAPIGKIPDNIHFPEAASLLFGTTAAMHFLEKANLQLGQTVLIYGASGALGTAAVQLAKHSGAEVTAVCSASNAGLVKALGADHVIDYAGEDFTKHTGQYDVVFETVNKLPYRNSLRLLKKNGVLLLAAAGMSEMLSGVWTSLSSKQKVVSGLALEKPRQIEHIRTLVQNGELKPVIDRSYPLSELAEAHRYVETGHKKGNVVVLIP